MGAVKGKTWAAVTDETFSFRFDHIMIRHQIGQISDFRKGPGEEWAWGEGVLCPKRCIDCPGGGGGGY